MIAAGSTAAITGGGRGIGRVLAQTLARNGFDVIVLARSQSELDETVASIGGKARAMTLDVTDASAITRVFAEIGPLDLLINNAGDAGPIGPFDQNDASAWWRTQEVNVRGPMLCTHAALPGMLARHSGRIINMSSGAANLAIPNFSAYVLSKSALNKFTELVALEATPHGVAVFAVSPGPVKTAMSDTLLHSEEGKKWLPWFEGVIKEHGVPPERVADLVVRLASGKYDALSGRFLSHDDDLDALLGVK